MAKLSEAAKKKYLKADGTCCPYCGSKQIEGQSVEIDGGGASQEVSCLKCGEQWVDCYELMDVIAHE